MDAEEISERVKRHEREKARDGRIDWYDRNVPIWWGELKKLFSDPVWEGRDLNEYCKRWFACPEDGMRVLLGLSPVREAGGIGKKEDLTVATWPGKGGKKVMTPAERARAYRARKAGK